jgi:hypothetical protein
MCFIFILYVYKAFILYSFNDVKEEGLPLLNWVEFHVFVFFVEPDDGCIWSKPITQ